MHSVSAIAHTNIALIKYWGKAPGHANLPATGSLSLTLDAFYTQTTLEEAERDQLILNGLEETGERLTRVQTFLEAIRKSWTSGQARGDMSICVRSENHVPTQAGLASSASGFAALACAANEFFKLGLEKKALSELARQGSGSAARSIFPGLVQMHVGGYAEPVKSGLELNLIVVECGTAEKSLDSRAAMNLTAQTSPYYPAWVSSHTADLNAALCAIQNNEFDALGEAVEHSTLKMHASLMAAKPGYWYFEPLSLQVMSQVRVLRAQGLSGYFTLDAGPHVKVLCEVDNAEIWQQELAKIPGVFGVQIAKPGPGAYLV